MKSWPWRGLAVVWSSDPELADTLVGALNVLGYSALVPGARSLGRICKNAAVVVVDRRDLPYLPSTCAPKNLIEVDGGAAEAAAYLLRALGAREAIIGVDPGRALTGYALLARNSLVHGDVLRADAEQVGEFICRLVEKAPASTIVGIGAAPAVAEEASQIASRIMLCGVRPLLIDESGSNSELPLGLNGVGPWTNIHVRAAAVIALRTRISSLVMS